MWTYIYVASMWENIRLPERMCFCGTMNFDKPEIWGSLTNFYFSLAAFLYVWWEENFCLCNECNFNGYIFPSKPWKFFVDKSGAVLDYTCVSISKELKISFSLSSILVSGSIDFPSFTCQEKFISSLYVDVMLHSIDSSWKTLREKQIFALKLLFLLKSSQNFSYSSSFLPLFLIHNKQTTNGMYAFTSQTRTQSD